MAPILVFPFWFPPPPSRRSPRSVSAASCLPPSSSSSGVALAGPRGRLQARPSRPQGCRQAACLPLRFLIVFSKTSLVRLGGREQFFRTADWGLQAQRRPDASLCLTVPCLLLF